MQYEIITYDVWGNEKDGFEVNNAFSTGTIIDVTDSDSEKDIISKLKAVGIIRKGFRFSSFSIDGEASYSLYVTYEPTMYPVCELRKVED